MWLYGWLFQNIPPTNIQASNLEFLGCIEDPWVRRRWEKLLAARHGMHSSMKVQGVHLYVYPRNHPRVNCTAIDCRAVDCKSISDKAAFKIGGKSSVLQKYVIGQMACARVMESVLTHLEAQEWRITFICDHGKHRSMSCAKVCQLMLLPWAWIYQKRKNSWFRPWSRPSAEHHVL